MSFDVNRRFNGLQEEMEKFDIDLAIYSSCENFQYLTGLIGGPLTVGSWRRAIDLGSPVSNLFVGRGKEPILTLPRFYEDRRGKPQTWIKDVRVLEDAQNPTWGFRYGENYGILLKEVFRDLYLKPKAEDRTRRSCRGIHH